MMSNELKSFILLVVGTFLCWLASYTKTDWLWAPGAIAYIWGALIPIPPDTTKGLRR